jgi:hypothetical protein
MTRHRKLTVMIVGKNGRYWPRTCWVYPCELGIVAEMTYRWTRTPGWGGLR